MDATKEPPKEFLEKFDLCICADVMEHVESPERFLRFITKILRCDGSLSMTFPINNLHHGRNYFRDDDVYDLFSRIREFKSNIKIVELNRFSSLVDRFYNNVQKIIKPTKEADIFEETVCFEIINNPKKFHYFIKVGTILLFKISQNAYHEDKSGNRAFIHAVKV
jgi:2-polyprenyl-3-methyl-5-hydroxy-6-metoxy-1,4-benzoquinol methylase